MERDVLFTISYKELKHTSDTSEVSAASTV